MPKVLKGGDNQMPKQANKQVSNLLNRKDVFFSLEVNIINEVGKEHEHPRAISKEENKKENVKMRTVYNKLIS